MATRPRPIISFPKCRHGIYRYECITCEDNEYYLKVMDCDHKLYYGKCIKCGFSEEYRNQRNEPVLAIVAEEVAVDASQYAHIATAPRPRLIISFPKCRHDIYRYKCTTCKDNACYLKVMDCDHKLYYGKCINCGFSEKYCHQENEYEPAITADEVAIDVCQYVPD
jgi:hypothetical protein